MIIVVANVTVKQGSQEDFLKNAQPCIAATRQEDANISYKLLQSTENDCEFTFVEEWESQEGLGQHMKSAHFGAFGQAIQNLLAKPLDIASYSAEKL